MKKNVLEWLFASLTSVWFITSGDGRQFSVSLLVDLRTILLISLQDKHKATLESE
jgi:hypothetical protein